MKSDKVRAKTRRRQVGRAAKVAQAAALYVEKGWHVLPLYWIRKGGCSCTKGLKCKSPGKHPILKGGVNAATNDVAKVKELWRSYPGANIGIATGKISGFIAVDVDPRNGGDESFSKLKAELGATPRTPLSATGGGGSHRLFSYPSDGLATRHNQASMAGIDVQSDGAYIVAPPSSHASGRRYRWRKDRDPMLVPLATLPGDWLNQLRASAVPPRRLDPPITDMIAEGRRNTHLTGRAGVLRNAGLSTDALLAALSVENTERCNPPLDEDEVARIAGSVGRYPAGSPSTGDEAEGVMRAVLDQHFANGSHLLRLSDGRFWNFEGTRWAPLSQSVLSGIILKEIQAMPGRRGQSTATLMQQVLRLMEAQVAADGDPLRFKATPLPVINCQNGELWIKDDGRVELQPHKATSFLRIKLDVRYDPAATCPRYDEAILQIFGKASEPAAMVNFWHELVGYAIQPDRRIPVVMLGWGVGNNGKTRLLETFTRLAGHDLVVAMPIGEVDKSRFSTGNLLGKLALIDDDVRAGTRLPDGLLKRLSEEKTLTGEHKYGQPFTFTARTAIFMLFNNPPSLADLSYGMQRRMFVVPFDKSFEPKETNPGLFKAIWADELPGVLNRYLAGLRRMIGLGWALKPPKASLEAKSRLLRAANPLPTFIKERCERTKSDNVQQLYDAYSEWARKAGITMSQQRLSFQRNLESLGYEVKHGNAGPKAYGLSLRSSPARPQN